MVVTSNPVSTGQQQSKHQFILTGELKQVLVFLGDFHSLLYVPAGERHKCVAMKSSIYFLHSLTKKVR